MDANNHSNKKLLFLYPVKDFFLSGNQKYEDIINLMNEMINLRYRQKGYQINYLVFLDREVAYFDVYEEDKILKSNVELSPCINNKQDIPYTDNTLIQEQLGKVDELVVCGFHEVDCVRKVARHFTDLGIDTMVDIELTEKLEEYCDLPSFNVSDYNFADSHGCAFARSCYRWGDDSAIYCPESSIYGAPYYKLGTVKPKHTWQEWLEIIKEQELSFENHCKKSH